jgi:hypothetical protein
MKNCFWIKVGFVIAVIAILAACVGCKAIHGLGGDFQDWTAPYAEEWQPRQ